MRWGRALGAVLLFAVVFGVGDTVLRLLVPAWAQPALAPQWSEVGRTLLLIAGPSLLVLSGMYVALTRLGWPPRSVGLPPIGAWGRPLAIGLAWGVGLAAVTIGLTLLGGARILVASGFVGPRFAGVVGPMVLGLVAYALVEELLFRGYPLSRVAQVGGPVAASAVLTVVFVALHLANPNVTPLGLVNIGLAGLALSGIFLAGGGLPAAWAMHVGWNVGLGVAADAPVSGLRFHVPVLEYVPGTQRLWDGGWFGPEGGLVATLTLGAAAAYWMRRLRATTPAEGVMA